MVINTSEMKTITEMMMTINKRGTSYNDLGALFRYLGLKFYKHKVPKMHNYTNFVKKSIGVFTLMHKSGNMFTFKACSLKQSYNADEWVIRMLRREYEIVHEDTEKGELVLAKHNKFVSRHSHLWGRLVRGKSKAKKL